MIPTSAMNPAINSRDLNNIQRVKAITPKTPTTEIAADAPEAPNCSKLAPNSLQNEVRLSS